MSTGESPRGPSPPEAQPPPTRAPAAWHSVVTTLFRTIPDGVRKSQQVRARLLRGR